MKKKIMILILVLTFILIAPKVSAKYVKTTDSKEIIRIGKMEEEIPDLVFDNITLSATETNDSESFFTINANDELSGIDRIELYIDGDLYNTFEYDGSKSETKEFRVRVSNLPFYETCYAKGIDLKGNSKNSNIVTPNTSRINDLRDLLKFREMQNNKTVDFKNKDFYLLNDVNLSGNWEPIGNQNFPFEGKFHGENHLIKNLKLTVTKDSQGFFGVSNGEISELVVEGNITSTGSYYNIGGIVGENHGLLKNLKSNVTINCPKANRIGGIAGVSSKENGHIINCVNYKNITGYECVGGVCGFNSEAYIECCGNESNATITANFQCGGGVLGYLELNPVNKDCGITKSYNRGKVTGNKAIGGIVGAAWNIYNKSTSIKYCYNKGDITCQQRLCGGILGGTQYDLDGNDSSSNNVIVGCYNVSSVSGGTTSVYSYQITHSYATVTSSYYPMQSKNDNAYGTAMQTVLFKDKFGPSSLLYILESLSKGSWTISDSKNDGYPYFLWENEI